MIPLELIYHILSYTDIDTVVNYTLTSKDKGIFNETVFWHAFFNREKLPIYGNMDWVKKYFVTKKAMNEVEEISYILIADWYQRICIDLRDDEDTRVVFDVEPIGEYGIYQFVRWKNPTPFKMDDSYDYYSIKPLLVKCMILYPDCDILMKRDNDEERSIRKGKLNRRHQMMVDKWKKINII